MAKLPLFYTTLFRLSPRRNLRPPGKNRIPTSGSCGKTPTWTNSWATLPYPLQYQLIAEKRHKKRRSEKRAAKKKFEKKTKRKTRSTPAPDYRWSVTNIGPRGEAPVICAWAYAGRATCRLVLRRRAVRLCGRTARIPWGRRRYEPRWGNCRAGAGAAC